MGVKTILITQSTLENVSTGQFVELVLEIDGPYIIVITVCLPMTAKGTFSITVKKQADSVVSSYLTKTKYKWGRSSKSSTYPKVTCV